MTDRHEKLLERMLEDGALAARPDRVRAVWSGLELPPPAAPPPGFAGRIVARALAEGRAGTLGLPWRPAWARAAAAALVVAGVLLGAELGSLSPASAAVEAEAATPVWSTETLADSYLAAGDGSATAAEPAGADTASAGGAQ
jgi:hypothetical protein